MKRATLGSKSTESSRVDPLLGATPLRYVPRVPRPNHRRREGEAILRSLERQGWSLTGGGRSHFQAKCPCGLHRKTVHTTPSNPNYYRKLRTRLNHYTCWMDDL